MNLLRRIIKWFGTLDAPAESVELRFFLVRTGKYEISRLFPHDWPLTKEGEGQARQAAQTIRDKLPDGVVPMVLLCTDRPLHYRQTLRLIADELRVEPVPSGFSHPPTNLELSYFVELGRPVVMVVDGSNLADEINRWPGPHVEMDIMGPQNGSVHELVVTYRPATMMTPGEQLSRRFV